MRLLERKEVDKQKALQQQREVEEGKKLASRVDGLRETVAEEEKNLTQFRNKTVAAIRDEIDALQDQKSSLLDAVTKLRNERVELLVPLDAQWDEVTALRTVLDSREVELSEKEDDLARAREEIQREALYLENEKSRVLDERTRSKELVASSGKMYEDAKEALAEARNRAQVIVSGAELRHKEALLREERVIAQEKDVEMLRADTLAKLKDIANRERALTDKYQTLERTTKRLGIST